MPNRIPSLHRHKNGTYYIRRRIPNDVLSYYPESKKEISRSLNTKVRKEAIKAHRDADKALHDKWDELKEPQIKQVAIQPPRPTSLLKVLSSEVIDELCACYEAVSLAGDESRRKEIPYEDSEVDFYASAYEESLPVIKKALAKGDPKFFRDATEEFLRLSGYEVLAPEADLRRLATAFGRAALRTNQKLLNRFQGEDEPTPPLARALDTPLLSSVVKEYTTWYKKQDKHAMLKKVTSVLPLLIAIIGDKPIGTLKQSDFEAFFQAVHNLPPRWKDECRKQNITPGELARLKTAQISKGTFDGTYLPVVSAFIAEVSRTHQDKGWPQNLTVNGVKYVGSRREEESGQRHFRQSELETLFEGVEMAEFARTPAHAHKFWLPHVGLFTGARVNELCQLNPQTDILRDPESGVWYFHISAKGEAADGVKKAVKTETSKRDVPIHQKLIDLGFLEYIEHVRKGGHKQLFPSFPASVGRAAPKAAEWFGQFLRKIGLRDETPGARLVGMHAFRSTFLNRAQALQVVGAEHITGHSTSVTGLSNLQSNGQMDQVSSAVVRKYKGSYPVPLAMAILEKITFDIEFFKPVTPGPETITVRRTRSPSKPRGTTI